MEFGSIICRSVLFVRASVHQSFRNASIWGDITDNFIITRIWIVVQERKKEFIIHYQPSGRSGYVTINLNFRTTYLVLSLLKSLCTKTKSFGKIGPYVTHSYITHRQARTRKTHRIFVVIVIKITSKFSLRLILGYLGAVTCTNTGVVLDVVTNSCTGLPNL